jgi:uncharacterized protein (TIGR02246 family)
MPGANQLQRGAPMRRCGLFLALLTLPASVAPAQAGNAQAEIRAVLDRQVAAWNRGDLQDFMDTYWKSPQTAYVGASGVMRGWEAVLKRYQREYPDRQAMGTVKFSDIEVTLLSPDSAYVLGRWQLQRERGDRGGVFSLVFRKFPEGWRIVLDHTSVVSPVPQK